MGAEKSRDLQSPEEDSDGNLAKCDFLMAVVSLNIKLLYN